MCNVGTVQAGVSRDRRAAGSKRPGGRVFLAAWAGPTRGGGGGGGAGLGREEGDARLEAEANMT